MRHPRQTSVVAPWSGERPAREEARGKITFPLPKGMPPMRWIFAEPRDVETTWNNPAFDADPLVYRGEAVGLQPRFNPSRDPDGRLSAQEALESTYVKLVSKDIP